jgi:hypothetical protein
MPYDEPLWERLGYANKSSATMRSDGSQRLINSINMLLQDTSRSSLARQSLRRQAVRGKRGAKGCGCRPLPSRGQQTVESRPEVRRHNSKQRVTDNNSRFSTVTTSMWKGKIPTSSLTGSAPDDFWRLRHWCHFSGRRNRLVNRWLRKDPNGSATDRQYIYSLFE